MSGNREYKSDVFGMLMEDKQNALDLYNAVNHSCYADPNLVEINTLRRGISLTVRNDASFVLDMNLNIYEHQSTVCPNMPIRSLIYYGHILPDMINQSDLYGRRPVLIPTPHFVVFYNGVENQPEKSEQRLSDLFGKPTDAPEIELICTVYNINNGMNEKLLVDCPFLGEYMIFVTYVRENYERNGNRDLRQAIEEAIDRCIKENILREFLLKRRAEVVKVMELDYTFERRIELARRDSWIEGKEIGEEIGEKRGEKLGEKKGVLKSQIQLVCRKLEKEKSFEQIVDEMEIPEEDVRVIYDTARSFAPEYDEEGLSR